MRLFDLHADTLTLCEQNGSSLLKNRYHVDAVRALSLYEQWHQILAVYVADDVEESDAWPYTYRCLQYLQNQCSALRHSEFSSKPFLLIPAIENGKAIGDDINRLVTLAEHGVFYLTVTWNGSNRLGNGCLSEHKDGLTPFGKTVIHELYRLGIHPDVSHLNEAGFWDVMEIADGRAVIASHSVSRTICNHPRNLTDSQFRSIVHSNGLVGLNVCAAQLGNQTFEQLERHLVHFLEQDGRSTLALGFDLDGTEIPKEWGGIQTAHRFYEYLLTKNYPDSLLNAIFFENSQAFLTKTLTSKPECIKIGT